MREPVASSEVFAVNSADVSYAERGKGELHAVQQLSVAVREGETVAIVGESGSGKSSLVRAALGLVPMRSNRLITGPISASNTIPINMPPLTLISLLLRQLIAVLLLGR